MLAQTDMTEHRVHTITWGSNCCVNLSLQVRQLSRTLLAALAIHAIAFLMRCELCNRGYLSRHKPATTQAESHTGSQAATSVLGLHCDHEDDDVSLINSAALLSLSNVRHAMSRVQCDGDKSCV